MNLFKSILFLSFLTAELSGFAFSNIIPTGSKPAGMGNAFVSQFNEFSVFHNQAGLADIHNTSISFFFENRFLIKQMSERAGLITFPMGNGAFALQYNSFGPPEWSESNAGIGYALRLSNRLTGGLQINYFGLRLPEENRTAMTASFELGAIYQLNDKTFLGLHIANPYSPSINTTSYNEHIPWRIKFGGHTNFTDDFILSYELEKIESFVPFVKVGAQWQAAESFFIRGGFNTSPSRFFTGFGYETTHFTFDTAFSYHQYLGYVPSVSLIFSFF